MATERLSMRQIREILRQKWSLGRTHREVAQSLGISSGAVGATVLRARAAGLAWVQVEALDDEALHTRVYGPPRPATRRAQAGRPPRVAPSGIPRAASGRVPLHPILRGLPPLAPSSGTLDAPGPSRRREAVRRLRGQDA